MRVLALPRSVGSALTLLAVGVAIESSFPTFAAGQAATSASASTALPPELQRARAALDKYQDPVVAVHDGYLSSVACVEYLQGAKGHMEYTPGGMGVHFLNLQLIGPTLDPAKPQVLIYEPVGDKLRLAAAEWFVPTAAITGGKPPTIFGQTLQGPMEGHEPLQPKGLHHYDLHVWLWKENPAGVYSATNPAVKCPKGSYSFTEHAPKLVQAGSR